MNGIRLRSVTAAAGAAAVLAGLITAAGPAAAAGAAACAPAIELLPALPGMTGGSVAGFGAGGLVVGQSGDRPVYWTGAEHTVHAVPLPAGYDRGSVKAVSAKGLMVGTALRSSDNTAVAFTHQQGAAASRALTAPAPGHAEVAVDVNEAGRVVAVDAGVAKEWVNGKAVRELPVPADAIPGSKVVSLNGINKRGDIVGTVTGSYFDADNDIEVTKTFPVVWPAGGGYPPYSLKVWNGYHRAYSTVGRDIDDRGRVVGLEDYYYRNDPLLTPAVWQKPYDALPTDPGRVKGYHDLEFNGSSPTTNVAVGTATTFEESWPSRFQAVYWPGKGAPLALPFPAGTPGTPLSRAFAAGDDDRVGGTLLDRETRQGSAVIWTCASKQAYAPQG
ncbi:hypothetical protein [Streptomyces sp. NBC_01565]|uniref:hypothetical protein n=1 Tax=Streptomyces sp. NBC_01565 TaxID=2975881 RepID=UPI0022594EFB|nr:hypothetical protein [Streptomyces sp. NBC_01565]MCX4539737.1 hypothetical protein [Streptomyces sp. NBC_01565]